MIKREMAVFVFTVVLQVSLFGFDANSALAITYKVESFTKEGGIDTGTAVAIGPKGRLVTALHVIENYKKIRVLSYNKKEYAAKVVAVSQKRDLALLKIDAENIPYAHTSTKTTLDQPVYLLGYDGLLTKGSIAQIKSDGLLINIDTKQGTSGGGIFDKKNNLLGILLHKDILRNMFFAASVNSFKSIDEPYKEGIRKKELSFTNNYDTSYCHDPHDLAVWKKFSKSKELKIQELHALFIGLCKKVENHDLTTEQADYIFENARKRLLGN